MKKVAILFGLIFGAMISAQENSSSIEKMMETAQKEGKPLVVVDGKVIDFQSLKNMDKNQIENIHILKGQEATALYAQKAQNGLIVIQTKSGNSSKKSKNEPENEPKLYLIDEKEVEKSQLDKISPDQIEKVEVFKGEKTIEKYGEKAKNGVISVKLRKK